MGPRLALALALLAAGPAACGPVVYVNEVTRHADDAVAAARHAEAEKLAPYWWTRATQYLHKARERAAHADFQGANRFGRLATEAARQAIVDAQDPSKRPIDLEEQDKAKGGGAAPAPGDAKPPSGAAPAPGDAKPPSGAAPAPAPAPAPTKGAS
jgi:sRNA-binding protein